MREPQKGGYFTAVPLIKWCFLLDGKEVAVKQLRAGANAESGFAELRAEAWIMKRLVHPCIIQLIGISKVHLKLSFFPAFFNGYAPYPSPCLILS